MHRLEKVKKFLDKQGLSSVLESEPLPCLLVHGGVDSKHREQNIIISLHPVPFEKHHSKTTHEGYARLQIDAALPFKVKDSALADVAQFLHFINLQLEFPGFYLNHLDSTIVYRCAFMVEEQISTTIVSILLGVILFLQDAFRGSLEQLAEGHTTFVALLQDIEKILGSLANTQPH